MSTLKNYRREVKYISRDFAEQRLQLINYLVTKHFSNVPDSVYDNDYRHNWKTSDFIEPIQFALKRTKKFLERIDDSL